MTSHSENSEHTKGPEDELPVEARAVCHNLGRSYSVGGIRDDFAVIPGSSSTERSIITVDTSGDSALASETLYRNLPGRGNFSKTRRNSSVLSSSSTLAPTVRSSATTLAPSFESRSTHSPPVTYTTASSFPPSLQLPSADEKGYIGRKIGKNRRRGTRGKYLKNNPVNNDSFIRRCPPRSTLQTSKLRYHQRVSKIILGGDKFEDSDK